MPFLRVDLAAPVPPELKRELLRRTAEVFAEITGSPIERIRTQVHELPADSFAVGGIAVSDSHEQAPFITLDLFRGRPEEQHTALIEQLSELVGTLVGVVPERVRLRINEVSPGCWGIGGVPATVLRKNEIAARADNS